MDGGFVEAYARLIAARLITVAALLVVVTGLAAFSAGYWLAQEPETFDQWMDKHERTCPQCGNLDGNGDLPPLCEEAYRRLGEELQK